MCYLQKASPTRTLSALLPAIGLHHHIPVEAWLGLVSIALPKSIRKTEIK